MEHGRSGSQFTPSEAWWPDGEGGGMFHVEHSLATNHSATTKPSCWTPSEKRSAVIFAKLLQAARCACMLVADGDTRLGVFHVEQPFSSGENHSCRTSRVADKVWVAVLSPYDLRAMT